MNGKTMIKNPELFTLAIITITGALAAGLHSEHDLSLVHDAAHAFAELVDDCEASNTAAQIALLATAQHVAQSPEINGSSPKGAHEAFARFLKLGARLELSLADRLGFESADPGDPKNEETDKEPSEDGEETTG